MLSVVSWSLDEPMNCVLCGCGVCGGHNLPRLVEVLERSTMDFIQALTNPKKLSTMSILPRVLFTALLLVFATSFSGAVDVFSQNFELYRTLLGRWILKLLKRNDYHRYITYEQKINRHVAHNLYLTS